MKVVLTDGDYTLIYRGPLFNPWVVAYKYDPSDGTWAQGHYFISFYEAVEFMHSVSTGE